MNSYFQFIPFKITKAFFPNIPFPIECMIFQMKNEMEFIEEQKYIELESYRKKKIDSIHEFIKIFHYRYTQEHTFRYIIYITKQMWWIGKELPDNFWKNFTEESFWNPNRVLKRYNYF